MNWNKQKLPVGSTRVVKKFAFLPVDLTRPEYEVVWLEHYYEKQVYVRRYNDYAWEYVETFRSDLNEPTN